MEAIDNSECFIITPIGDENSIIRKKTEGLLLNVIKPVCKDLSLAVVVAHEIDKLGSITNQVIQKILDSKIVIANLTGLNPNVMYELAIRHSAKLPVVCLAEFGTKLPFDINTERTIFYTDDMYGAENLKIELRKKVEVSLIDDDIDNPIYRAIKEKSILKELKLVDNPENSSLSYIIDRLDSIEKSVNQKMAFAQTSMEEDIRPTFVRLNFDRKMSEVQIRTFVDRLAYRLTKAGHRFLKYSKISDQELEILINDFITTDELSKITDGLVSKFKFPLVTFVILPF